MAYLKKELDSCKQATVTDRHTLAYSSIQDDDEMVSHFTGLPNSVVFNTVLDLCSRFEINYYYQWPIVTISCADQLFITLRKLRTNVSMKTLAWEYNVSRRTISNIFLRGYMFCGKFCLMGL